MPKRVIIGHRSDINETGMWISAPGKDAASANSDDLLVDTTRFNIQYVQKGIIISPTLPLISDTHYTTYENVYVCDTWDGYWGPPGGYRWEWVSKWWQADGGDYEWVWYDNNTWYVYCKTGHWTQEQVAHNGIATYQQAYYHGLGYRPLGLFSVQADQPSTPVPQLFLDENYIYARYYEAANGQVFSGIAYFGTTPSSYTFGCQIHYTLYNRSF